MFRLISSASMTAGLFVVWSLPLRGEETLNGHRVALDESGKLRSWVQPQDEAYDVVVRRAWNFLLETVPVESNGLKTFYTHCCLDLKTMRGTSWPHNPAGLYAMLADSAAAYYAYSGDRRVVDLVKGLLDYQLQHGTTPANWKWASVPYASSDHGAIEYRGAFEFQYDQKNLGRGDGYGVIEPDKAGELGAGYLKFWQLTGESRYRDAALACAQALARNARAGNWDHSPWPFRVYAETGHVREEYSSNVIGPIRLLDELIRLQLGDVGAYRKVRDMAWIWLMEFPMRTNYWSGYFEDIPLVAKPTNFNQYTPMETARYLIQHPEFDVEWQIRVPRLIEWVEKQFVMDVPGDPGVQWGANAVSEQVDYMPKMGSHTSRYASVNAMWHEASGDPAAKEKALRSFNWASYMCRDDGAVIDGPRGNGLWFSDGYGDYIRHFLAGMGAVPEWAPAGSSHLLRSSSLVVNVDYAPTKISYKTFDRNSTEVLRLSFAPQQVLANGEPLARRGDASGPGWFFDAQSGVLRVNHSRSTEIQVIGAAR